MPGAKVHRRVALGIFLAVTGCVLLLGSRERPWGDAQIQYMVAERIVTAGSVDISKEWPPMSHRGRDGKIYSQYALAPSLVHVPGVALRQALDRAAPDAKPLTLVVTSHLAPAMLAALTCVVFFGMCRRLGAGVAGASLATLTLAFATSVFVYARSPFSEILQAAAFTGFLSELLRVREEPTRRRAIALGLWAGLLFNAKAVFALSIAGGLVFLAVWTWLWGDRRALRTIAVWFAAAALPLLAVALAYNWVRWGNPLDTGYGATLDLMREKMFAGLWGLLFSPGKSVFLYSPPIVLGMLALARVARTRTRAIPWALAATCVPPVLFYATFLSWAGDYCWGPRYLVFLLPAALLPAALVFDDVARGLVGKAGKLAVAGVVAAGVFVQILGASFYWDLWIRTAKEGRQSWLGRPDRAGAAIAEAGRGHCDSCFEDMHGHQWLPPFSPLEGHAWLLRHVPFGHAWERAEKDAPWKRYTSLELSRARSVYEATRVDWWGNLWRRDHRRLRGHGIAWTLGFTGLAVAGAVLWLGAVRRARERDGDDHLT